MRDLSNFLTKIGTLGCLGYSKIMPGTVGAFCGTIFSYVLFFFFRQPVVVIATILLMLLAFYICDVSEKTVGCKDPSCVIFDEFIAMPICFLFVFESWKSIWLFLLGFIIFRIFDIIKPFGLKKLENLPGGLGIVLDDVGAAVYTNLVLQVLIFFC